MSSRWKDLFDCRPHPFKLPQNTSHENTLLIRDQYVLAYDIILADTRKGKKRKSAFLVTGQTGIGVLGYPFLQRIFANLTLSIYREDTVLVVHFSPSTA